MITPPGRAPDKRMEMAHQKTAIGEIEPSWRFGKPANSLNHIGGMNACLEHADVML